MIVGFIRVGFEVLINPVNSGDFLNRLTPELLLIRVDPLNMMHCLDFQSRGLRPGPLTDGDFCAGLYISGSLALIPIWKQVTHVPTGGFLTRVSFRGVFFTQVPSGAMEAVCFFNPDFYWFAWEWISTMTYGF